MKIGLINTLTEDSPLAKVFGMICKDVSHLETQIYQSEQFNPNQIQQDNLNYILMYGAIESDDGLAKAIHKHSSVPLLYLIIPGYGREKERYNQLQETGIEVYHVLKTDQHRGSEDLIARLKKLGEQL